MGYVKTATEVSADNSALMRNIKKHGNALAGAVADVAHATMECARTLGEEIPPEGEVTVQLDDSIVQDTDAEKKQDMAEVATGLMRRWEYRAKWYGEDEDAARRGSEDPSATSPAGRQKGSSPPALTNSDYLCFSAFSVAPRSHASISYIGILSKRNDGGIQFRDDHRHDT